MTHTVHPSGIRLGIARGISYGLFGPPEQIRAPRRELGAGPRACVRLLEPGGATARAVRLDGRRRAADPARRERGAVAHGLLELAVGDAAADRLPASVTRARRRRLPPVRAARWSRAARGRVSYWQCDNEPSNIGLLWAGTAGEYAAQLGGLPPRRQRRRIRRPRSSSAVAATTPCRACPTAAARGFFDEVLAGRRPVLRSLRCAPLRRPDADPRAHRHRPRHDAPARLRAASRRRRIQRADAVRASRSSTACSRRRWRRRSRAVTTSRCPRASWLRRPRSRRPSAAR